MGSTSPSQGHHNMSDRPTLEELKDRLHQEITHFGGLMPERVAIAWDGYVAALLEWNLITPTEHQEVLTMLPEVPDNPVMAIFLGRR
jgi:hypothetical protein